MSALLTSVLSMNTLTVALFQGQKIRKVIHQNEWWFSVVDVVQVLTDQSDDQTARKYWNKLAQRLYEEGSEVVTNCHRLKLLASDNKLRETDCANTEGIFRIVQSIPSPKAEPFKRWLAKVGYERVQEIDNPEISLDRARKNWQMMGRPEPWIEQRMRGQDTRNKLTKYWGTHGVKEGVEYAKLTDVIHQEWSGVTTNHHKKLKGLKRENLRDHMTEAELIFTALAELSTREIAQTENAEGYKPNEIAAKKGGFIAHGARTQLEAQTGRKVVSPKRFLPSEERMTRKRLK